MTEPPFQPFSEALEDRILPVFSAMHLHMKANRMDKWFYTMEVPITEQDLGGEQTGEKYQVMVIVRKL